MNMTAAEAAIERSRLCDSTISALNRTCGTLHSVAGDAEAAVTAVCQCLDALASALPREGEERRIFEKVLVHLQFQDRMAQRLAGAAAVLDAIAEALQTWGGSLPQRDSPASEADWEQTLVRMDHASMEADHGSTVDLF
jgi:hypothetical protein